MIMIGLVVLGVVIQFKQTYPFWQYFLSHTYAICGIPFCLSTPSFYKMNSCLIILLPAWAPRAVALRLKEERAKSSAA
jgi:hypothetical protein